MLLKRLKRLWRISAEEERVYYPTTPMSREDWEKIAFTENDKQLAQFIKPSSKDILKEITNE